MCSPRWHLQNIVLSSQLPCRYRRDKLHSPRRHCKYEVDGYTVVASLVYEVRKMDILDVHRIYMSSMLATFVLGLICCLCAPNPSVFCTQFSPNGAWVDVALHSILLKYLPIRRRELSRRRQASYQNSKVGIHVRPIHDVQNPERWLTHEEVIDRYFGNVLEDKRHRT